MYYFAIQRDFTHKIMTQRRVSKEAEVISTYLRGFS